MDYRTSLKTARAISTPLVAVETPDQPATVKAICALLPEEESRQGKKTPVPKIEWDLLRGLVGVNPAGIAAVERLPKTQKGYTLIDAVRFQTSVSADMSFPMGTVLLIHNMHLFLDKSREAGLQLLQGLINFRDVGKDSGRMIIGLGTVFTLPPEIKNDVLLLDEPLPTDDDLVVIIKTELGEVGIDKPEPPMVANATAALRGLANFPAKQVTAMCVSKKSGINIDGLWERKRAEINRTRGLKVVPRGPGLSDIGGMEEAKRLLGGIFTGNNRPYVVGFIDEIEKMVAGNGTDSSGVSTEMLGEMLTEMETQGYIGLIFVGFPGGGKSAFASAVGSEYDAETVHYNLSQMKSGVVGSSMEYMVQANRVMRAISGGRACFLATCNGLGTMPPELLRRFTLGIMLADLPTPKELEMIWPIWMRKYKLKDQPLPDCTGWVGANVKQCCDLAYRMNRPLVETASFVIPITRSAPEKVLALRQEANNRYLSASYPGAYVFDPKQQDTLVLAGRAAVDRD